MSAVELVRCVTSDNVRLDGAYQATSDLTRPACLFLHGTGGNFYSPGVLEQTAQLALAGGLATLRVNTRGHDVVSHLGGPNPDGGGAYERIADAELDMAAWLEWLYRRGHSRVILVGHSMGAVKCIMSQATQPSTRVSAILAISPPRFHFPSLHQHPRADRFRQDFARANELVRNGCGDELMHVAQPLSSLTSAQTFLEKYGPECRFDFVPQLKKLACPTLVLIGSLSEATSIAFDGTVASIIASEPGGLVAVERVEGADITYRKEAHVPWQRFLAFLAARGILK